MAPACFLHNTSRGIQQYKQRHPALVRQYPTMPTRYPTSGIAWAVQRIANNCSASKNPQMRKRWIFDQIWYGRDMAPGLVVFGVRWWLGGQPATLTISLRKAIPLDATQSPPQNTSSCHIQQSDYCQPSLHLILLGVDNSSALIVVKAESVEPRVVSCE